MNKNFSTPALKVWAAAAVFAGLAGCSNMQDKMSSMMGSGQKLSGAQEVPAVTTGASGSGTIKVAADGSVTGAVSTSGMDGTMAHIHVAPAGTNGPVIIPLVNSGGGVWSVPSGAKLTPEQMKRYEAGDLYVNVHTAANKGGEVRAQLKP